MNVKLVLVLALLLPLAGCLHDSKLGPFDCEPSTGACRYEILRGDKEFEKCYVRGLEIQEKQETQRRLAQEKRRQEQQDKDQEQQDKELNYALTLRQKGGLSNLREALDIYSEYEHSFELKNTEIEIAKEKERLLDYKGSIELFEKYGLHEDARRVRRKMLDEKKVDQTVVHGDYVDDRDTIIKDSVISKSSIGAGGDDKFARLEKLTVMKEKGLIDNEEFQQMKKEILGK